MDKAKKVLLKALVEDINLLDGIIERSCIRWVEGYSDSLLEAVLCNMGLSTEERGGEVKQKTVWIEEIRKLFGAEIKLSESVKQMLDG